jgi:hypothetical protein
MSYKLSKKEIVKEIVKCGKDPVYFTNNYARISHPIKGLIPFKTYPYQADLLQDFNDYRFTVILKARQLGISTIAAAYIVWLMLFYRDKNILVMATKFATAANLVKKVKAIMKNLPEWLVLAMLDVRKPFPFWCLTRLPTLITLKSCGPVFILQFLPVVVVLL